jgi:hypothetical protein
MADKKYTMQILDEKGRIVKSETFSEVWEGDIREITLLPSEKKLLKDLDGTGKGALKIQLVGNILESRGLIEMDNRQKHEGVFVKDGVLIIDSTKNEKK